MKIRADICSKNRLYNTPGKIPICNSIKHVLLKDSPIEESIIVYRILFVWLTIIIAYSV